MYEEFKSLLSSLSDAIKEQVHSKLDEATVELEARTQWIVKKTALSIRKHWAPVVFETLFVAAGVIIFTIGFAQFLESILPIRGSGTMLAGAGLMLLGVYAKKKYLPQGGPI